jgi:hypothetical protein
MLCETCRYSGRAGFVRVAQNIERNGCHEMIPCPECGGQGIAHCCDGLCEQPIDGNEGQTLVNGRVLT